MRCQSEGQRHQLTSLFHWFTHSHTANPLLATISSTSASLLASETDFFPHTPHWWGRRGVTQTSLIEYWSCEHQRRLMMWFVGLTIMLPVITEMMMTRGRDDGICVSLPHCFAERAATAESGSAKERQRRSNHHATFLSDCEQADGPAVSSSSAAASDVTQKLVHFYTFSCLSSQDFPGGPYPAAIAAPSFSALFHHLELEWQAIGDSCMCAFDHVIERREDSLSSTCLQHLSHCFSFSRSLLSLILLRWLFCCCVILSAIRDGRKKAANS